MYTASPELTKQPTTPRGSDQGERLAVEVTKQTRADRILPRPINITTSFINAKLLVRPQVQEVHATGREVFEFVRQCAGMGRFYIVLEAVAQGVLIASPHSRPRSNFNGPANRHSNRTCNSRRFLGN